MELKELIGNMLDKSLDLAKQKRAEEHYSGEFPQTILILGPTLEVALVPMLWSTEAEKFHKFKILSEVARETLASAVILIVDTRWVEEATIVEKMGIRPSSEIGVEEFQKQYVKIRREQFAGDAGNFPPDWYTDALIAIAKGPTIPVIMRYAPYKQGANDSIEWMEPKNRERYRDQFNLLPDWWC